MIDVNYIYIRFCGFANFVAAENEWPLTFKNNETENAPTGLKSTIGRAYPKTVPYVS